MNSGVAAAYSLQALQDMLGISRGDVLGFIKAGFIAPERGARNAYRFSFQDVVLLRTAHGLRRADISATKIRKSLKRLRALLPDEMPLTGLRIAAIGEDIAVLDRGQAIAADTGQLLFDFEVAADRGAVLSFPPASEEDDASDGASDPDSRTADAFIVEGARHVDAKSFADALLVYDRGIDAFPEDGTLHFNRAVVLEDLGRADDALAAYARCLALEPDFADAHWNLARLYEQRGVETLALRHFSAYRRLGR